jgi:hypothetical protein
MYRDPDEQAREATREAGYTALQEQQADDAQDFLRELTREELMLGRVRQVQADLRRIAAVLAETGTQITATRSAEDWLRYLEGRVSDALTNAEHFVRDAQPTAPLLPRVTVDLTSDVPQ